MFNIVQNINERLHTKSEQNYLQKRSFWDFLESPLKLANSIENVLKKSERKKCIRLVWYKIQEMKHVS